MNKDELKELLKQIKIFYPRFEGVEKAPGGLYQVSNVMCDAWYKQIGWLEFDRAIAILDRYMLSDSADKTPKVSLWITNGNVQASKVHPSAFFDRRHGVIRWRPELNGPVYELPVSWSEQQGCYVDQEGQLWGRSGD